MGALLEQARARQSAEPQPAIDATEEIQDRLQHSAAVACTRPLGLAIIAWCDSHPENVGRHRNLVEDLRDAMAAGRLINAEILAIWEEIPETVEVGYQRRVAV